MSTEREARCVYLQLIRDGVVTTIGVPTEPDDDELAAGVGVVKVLKAVFGVRVDAVLEAIFDYRTADLDREWEAHELN